MKNDNPDWFVLIYRWVTPGGVGYSLPFLVGARALKKKIENVTIEDARAILEEIFNPKSHLRTLELTWCPDLDVPVFGLYQEKFKGVTIYSKHTQKPSIVVRNDIVKRWGDSSEQLMSSLIEFYHQPIESGNFSRSGKSWGSFTDVELNRIKNLIC